MKNSALIVLLAIASLLPTAALAQADICATPQIPGGKLTISRVALDNIEVKFAANAYLKAADGPSYRFAISGLLDKKSTTKNIPSFMDTMMVSVQISNDKTISGPALLYFTRDGFIPIDLAPAKLWYPEYKTANNELEFLDSLGDLERSMQFGPDEAPATRISWLLKAISQHAIDENVISSGEIPLAPIWAARDAMKRALEECLPQG